MHMA